MGSLTDRAAPGSALAGQEVLQFAQMRLHVSYSPVTAQTGSKVITGRLGEADS
jgi:hypothetical protein